MKIVKKVPIKKKDVNSHHEVHRAQKKNSFMVYLVFGLIILLVAAFLNADKITNNVTINNYFIKPFGNLFTKDTLVAKVNGNPIYLSEVDDQYSKVPEMYRMFFTPKVILDQIISQEVLVEQAKKMNVDIPNSEMDVLLNDAINKSGKTKDEFVELLKAQNTTLEKIKEYYKLSLIIDKLITQEVVNKVEVSDDEVMNYYNENKELYYYNGTRVKAAHILVSTTKYDDNTAYELAMDYRNKYLDGYNFYELAANFSDDPTAKMNGGELGFFGKGDMVPEFETATFSMMVGEVSMPIKTQFGYHIILKEDEVEAGYMTYEEMYDSTKKVVLDEKQKVAVEAYISNLRQNAVIEYFGEFDESLTADSTDNTETILTGDVTADNSDVEVSGVEQDAVIVESEISTVSEEATEQTTDETAVSDMMTDESTEIIVS